jgi:hypothetical protein
MFVIAYIESIFEANQVFWMTTVDLGFILCLLLAPLTWLSNLLLFPSLLRFCAPILGLTLLALGFSALGTGFEKGFVTDMPHFNKDTFLSTIGFSVYVFAGVGQILPVLDIMQRK